MYILAKSRTLKSGKKAHTFSLAVSYRVDGNPKQRTILNLGQDFTIPQQQWNVLTQMIEQTFRSMKSELGLRPIYHRDKPRVEAHLFLSILAFHMAHLIRSKLRIHKIHSSWGTLKVRLNHQMRVTTVLPQNKTHCILAKQDENLKPFQRNVFQVMGLKLGKNAKKVKAKRPQEEEAEM